MCPCSQIGRLISLYIYLSLHYQSFVVVFLGCPYRVFSVTSRHRLALAARGTKKMDLQLSLACLTGWIYLWIEKKGPATNRLLVWAAFLPTFSFLPLTPWPFRGGRMYKRKKNLRFDQLHYNNDTEKVLWLPCSTVHCRTSKTK